MSTYQDFLDEALKEGQSHVSTRGIGAIGSIKIEMGYHLCPKGHKFWDFWKPILHEKNLKEESEAAIEKKLKEASKAAFDSCKEKLKAAGYNEGPKFGVKITLYADILSGDHYRADRQEFNEPWTDAGKMIIESMGDNEFPTNQVFYGQVKSVPDPYKVKQGDSGKTAKDKDGNLFNPPRFPNILVPVLKFGTKQEALDFITANGGVNDNNNDLPNFSELAKSNYPDLNSLQSSAEEINEWLAKAHQGIEFNNNADGFPLPVPPTPANLKKYIAAIYQIEAGDINLLQEIPF